MCAVKERPVLTHLYFCHHLFLAPTTYSGHVIALCVQNHVCQSEAAKVHALCVSRDNNNRHMVRGMVLGVKRARRRPVENFENFWPKMAIYILLLLGLGLHFSL